MARLTKVGFPIRPTRQQKFEEIVTPTSGFTDSSPVFADPSSFYSGQNVWIKSGAMFPRSRLSSIGTTSLVGEPNGLFIYDTITGGSVPVVTSQDTVAYFQNQSFTTLTYASGVSNLPPTGAATDEFFGTTVYLESDDNNIAVFTNGIDPVFAAEGPSTNTAFSTLTEAPICTDIALFDNKLVGWNIEFVSTTSRLVQRVQWSVSGDPEDWTGVGSGFEDLVDMRGAGTRIFATEDRLILATDKEVWQGRRVGFPFIFSFSAIDKTIGMPFGRPVIQTQRGIFWLNDDFNIYRVVGGRITPVGDAIKEILRRELVALDEAFFGFNEQQGLLTLYYPTSAGGFARKAFALDIVEGHWTPHTFTQELVISGAVGITTSDTTWGGLTGTLDEQNLTFDELLGISGAVEEAVFSSDGTAYIFHSGATGDDGSTVEEDAYFGGLFKEDFTSVKFLNEVKLDVSADVASTLSVAGSNNLGETFGEEVQLSISASSTYTQAQVNFNTLSGVNPSLRIRSDDGSRWKVARYYAKAVKKGRSF